MKRAGRTFGRRRKRRGKARSDFQAAKRQHMRARRRDWSKEEIAARAKNRSAAWQSYRRVKASTSSAKRAWRKLRKRFQRKNPSKYSRRLTKNFHAREFDQKDGRARVPRIALPALREQCKQVYEPLRAEFGRCTIGSGYRTGRYNSVVLGQPTGYSTYHNYLYRNRRGRYPAGDSSYAKGSPEAWHRSANRRLRYRGGLGVYPRLRFIHTDPRPGGPARWRGTG